METPLLLIRLLISRVGSCLAKLTMIPYQKTFQELLSASKAGQASPKKIMQLTVPELINRLRPILKSSKNAAYLWPSMLMSVDPASKKWKLKQRLFTKMHLPIIQLSIGSMLKKRQCLTWTRELKLFEMN